MEPLSGGSAGEGGMSVEGMHQGGRVNVRRVTCEWRTSSTQGGRVNGVRTAGASSRTAVVLPLVLPLDPNLDRTHPAAPTAPTHSLYCRRCVQGDCRLPLPSSHSALSPVRPLRWQCWQPAKIYSSSALGNAANFRPSNISIPVPPEVWAVG